MSPARFKRTVWNHYKRHGRRLPWRSTKDPYKIFISEIMLQQTQVPRVMPKYQEFTERFPNFKALAQAPLQDVLKAWKGLGYNRRALNAKRAAEIIVAEHKGKLPRNLSLLVKLPGIGPNTAGSIAAFAFNQPVAFIETNIRSVFIHSFFNDAHQVSDRDILPLVEIMLDRKNPRTWYYALMDYGVYLKRTFKNPNVRSAHYARQSPFKGSRRELRSKVLSFVLDNPQTTLAAITKGVQTDKKLAEKILGALHKEGLVAKRGAKYHVE